MNLSSSFPSPSFLSLYNCFRKIIMMMLMTVMLEEAEGKMMRKKLTPVRIGNAFYVA